MKNEAPIFPLMGGPDCRTALRLMNDNDPLTFLRDKKRVLMGRGERFEPRRLDTDSKAWPALLLRLTQAIRVSYDDKRIVVGAAWIHYGPDELPRRWSPAEELDI